MEFAEGAEPSRQAYGGERFRITLERLGRLFGVVQTAGAIVDAFDRISQSNAVYPISPRPARGVDAATVDVKVKLERAGITVAEIVDRIQRAIGASVQVFSIRPLDLKELRSAVNAPAERERETQTAVAAGAGKTGPEKAVAGAQKAVGAAFKGARTLITTVIVVSVIVGVVVLLKPAREAVGA